jgi:DNA polymerase III delta prime subunit
MWVDKYAPHQLHDFIGNETLASKLSNLCGTECSSGVARQNCPHIILCGPSGVGKSTLVEMIIRSQIQPSEEHRLLLRLDSTQDRTIQNIRDKICQFVPRKVSSDKHKIVLFEQADKLGDGVQQLMRGLMEKYTPSTSFIFVCDFIHGMNDAVQSRSMVYQMQGLKDSHLMGQQHKILKSEAIEYDEEAIRIIATVCNGDMRQCINALQACCAACAPGPLDLEITKKVCLFPHFNQMHDMFEAMYNGQTRIALDHIITFHINGYSSTDIIMFMNTHCLLHPMTNTTHHLKLMREIAVGHVRVQGVDSVVQLCGIVVRMIHFLKR